MVIVKVPATTANIGPGYDSMGMALNLYNTFTFKRERKNVEDDNLILKSFNYFYDYFNLDLEEISIDVDENVPRSRGLGSSATCIVAGLMAANKFSGKNISKEEILKLATNIEGHPDNVAPAIYGGLITSVVNDRVYFSKDSVSDNLSFILLIPNFELSTELARQVVPKEVSIEDCVFNIARASLFSKALSKGDFNLLKGVNEDRIHEPYRRKLIEDFDEFEKLAKNNNAIINISGAGPSILITKEKNNKKINIEIDKKLQELVNWKALELLVDDFGAVEN